MTDREIWWCIFDQMEIKNIVMPKQPDKPIWKETEYYWIVVAKQVGPLKLLEIVPKEGYGDG